MEEELVVELVAANPIEASASVKRTLEAIEVFIVI